MAIVLLIKSEDGQTVELPILTKMILGRSSSCDFKILDTKISGQHCAVSINDEGQVLFEDLGSSNGSYVNNSSTHKALIKINDIIRIGNTLIKIDVRKLSPTERITIGSSPEKSSKEKTLPILSHTDPSDSAEKHIKTKRVAVVLNKDLLQKRKSVTNEWEGSRENLFEQEESSGHTKMLKLEKKKKS